MVDVEPTMGEVMRRLDATSRQMRDLATELRDREIQNAATYMRGDLYEETRSTDRQRVDHLNEQLAKLVKSRVSDATFRRQTMLTIIVMVVTILANVGIGVSNMIAR